MTTPSTNRPTSPETERRLAALERELHDVRRGSRRLRVALAAFVGVAGLLSALVAAADPTAAVPCDGRFSTLLYCFAADTPARADQVNHNFAVLAQWVEQKVGVVNADPSASTTGTGGLAVIGSATGANLSIDGDEIDARQNGVASALTLQRGGAGNVLIGGAGPDVTAKLQVAGSLSAQVVTTNLLSVGNGTGFRRIQAGTYGNCAVPNSAGSNAVVTFPMAFTSTPIVIAQPEEPDGSGCTSVRIKARSLTTFEFQSWTGGTLTACDCIHWLAFN
jgi:hypothetical protein